MYLAKSTLVVSLCSSHARVARLCSLVKQRFKVVFVNHFYVFVWRDSVKRFVVRCGQSLVPFGGVWRGSQEVFGDDFRALNSTFSNLSFLKDVLIEITTFRSLR